MENNDLMDALGRIQCVDPPPFLFTRIEARIAARVVVPRARLIAVACASAFLLLVNAAVLTRTSSTRSGLSLGDVVEVMGMNASNQLYE